MPAAVVLVGAVLVALHAHAYLPFLCDDALISLRYAQRLLAGQGLSWTDGVPVEGYSNLLWVLACAAGAGLGFPLVDVARVLGLVCVVATLAAPVAVLQPRCGREGLLALAPVLLLVSIPSLAIWSIGGMEQPLLAALVVWAVVSSYPLLEREGAALSATEWGPKLLPGCLLAGACLTRPDGCLLALGLGLGLWAVCGVRGGAFRGVFQLALLPLVAWVGQQVFRLVYYDAWLPNTAWAKVAFTSERVSIGVAYVGGGLVALGGIVIPAAVAMARCLGQEEHRRRVVLLAAPCGLWLAYLAVIGGDDFLAHRRLVPLFGLLALLCAEGVRGWAPGPRGWLLVAGLAASGASLLLFDHGPRTSEMALRNRWVWENQRLSDVLQGAFGRKDPLMAVDAAGSLPFFTGFRSVDMLGLNDATLARARPPSFGTGARGHELGDGSYILGRLPDLVLFCEHGTAHPCYRGGQELVALPEFTAGYRAVRIEVRGPGAAPEFVSHAWVRVDGSLGVLREPDRVVVPGYLLADEPASMARLDADGMLVTVVTPRRPALLRDLVLADVAWSARVEPPDPALKVRIDHGDRDGRVDVSVASVEGVHLLRRIVLEQTTAFEGASDDGD